MPVQRLRRVLPEVRAWQPAVIRQDSMEREEATVTRGVKNPDLCPLVENLTDLRKEAGERHLALRVVAGGGIVHALQVAAVSGTPLALRVAAVSGKRHALRAELDSGTRHAHQRRDTER